MLGSAAASAGAIGDDVYVALVAAVASSIGISTVVVRRLGPVRVLDREPGAATA